MSDYGGYQRGTRVYVGGLSEETKKEDLETEFEKFGKLNSVWVAFNPPGFAFVEFSNKTDAENACDSMNGTEFLGGKLRVEISRSRGRGGYRGGGDRGRGIPRGGFGGRGRLGGFRFGSPGGRGGPRRGGFVRGDFGGGYGEGGHEGYGAGGDGYGGGGYGNGASDYDGGRNGYEGGAGGASSYRSRSPIDGGGGGDGRY